MAVMRALTLFIVYIVAGSADLVAQGSPACKLNEAVVAQFVPAGAVDLTCIPVPDQRDPYLASWTTRSKNGEPTSHLRLLSVRDGVATVLDKHKISGGYAAYFQYTSRFDKSYRPIWILTAQYGGAQQDLWLVSLRQRRFQVFQALGGDYLDSTPSGDGVSLLVAHHAISGVDAPRLYRFHQGKFVNVSREHPAYYRDLMEKSELSSDGKNVNPTLYPQLAKLVSLSGDQLGARTLLEAYRSSQLSTHGS